MNDPEIRELFFQSEIYRKYFSSASYREEFEAGRSRVDIMLLNGDSIVGIEIKSDGDTLKRLDKQLNDYRKVFDKIYVLTTNKYRQKISGYGDDIGIIDIKEGVLKKASLLKNDLYCSSRLLWKDEVKALLEKHQLLKGNKSKPKYKLRKIVVDNLHLEDVKSHIIEVLKSREDYLSEYNA